MWTDYFDKIFLINLPHREDRLHSATLELAKYDIDFTVYQATKNDDGAKGLWSTMLDIFRKGVVHKWKRILVFEDDLQFVKDPNQYMGACIGQLTHYNGKEKTETPWDMLHLGPNTHVPLKAFSKNLLHLTHCRGTHAVAYSNQCMYLLTQRMRSFPGDIDVFFEKSIQPSGNCYCTFPLLCTQKNDFSDIEGKEVDQSYIVTRFYDNTKHLR